MFTQLHVVTSYLLKCNVRIACASKSLGIIRGLSGVFGRFLSLYKCIIIYSSHAQPRFPLSCDSCRLRTA